MADEIRADYDKLGQVAGRFDKQAQQINEMIRKVKADFEKLEHGGWIGQGADAFFQEMRGVVLPASQRLESALKNGSQVTKEISQRMHQAEEEASSPFKQTT
jgi:WXG100 family type VII secretion target